MCYIQKGFQKVCHEVQTCSLLNSNYVLQWTGIVDE